jgi:type VI secretion system protein ImpG
MQDRLITLFEEELTHLSRMADEFKIRHPEVADRLSLGTDPPDPYVQQLRDGFAYLTARVQLKLEAEFPRLIESLVQTVYPHYLAPLPSMAIVSVEPEWDNEQLATGPVIKAGSSLSAVLSPGDLVRCTYTTAHDLQVLPIRLTEARYFSRDLATVDSGWAARTGAQAAIRLRLRATAGLAFKQIEADKLVLYLPTREELGGTLYELLLARCTAVIVQSASHPTKTFQIAAPAPLRGMGFEDREALLPGCPRVFSGYRLLQEYFAFPERFCFVEVSGLRSAFAQCAGSELDLIFSLNQAESRLDNNRLSEDCVRLYCVPAINLFSMDNITVSLRQEREEHLVVPDRTRTLEYEVYSVDRVIGCPRGANKPDERFQFQPFYFASAEGADAAGFFTTRRVQRELTEQETRQGRPVAAYRGSNVYLSLAGEASEKAGREMQDLFVRARCSNRHLPSRQAEIRFECDLSAPVTSVKTISKTPPRLSHVQGRMHWRVISHFALNYRSLLSSDGEAGAAALQELLRLYAPEENGIEAAQIRALLKAAARPVFKRVEGQGPIAFARGLSIQLTFDEAPFSSTGVFLLGAVLNQFFSRFVTINSFIQTTISTKQRERVFQWPITKGS